MPNQSIINMFHSRTNEIQVTDSDLTKWVKKTLFPLQKNTNSPFSPVDLGQFGLKNAAEVVSFLKTHTGKMMESEMIAYAQFESAMQEQRLLEELLLQRLLASLFLSFAKEESEEDARKRVDVVHTQADKPKETAKPSMAPMPTISIPEIINQLEECKANYEEAIVELSKQIKENQAKQKNVTQKLNETKERKQEVVQLYQGLYEKFDEDLNRESIVENINRLRQSAAARVPSPAEQEKEKEKQIKMHHQFAEKLELQMMLELLAAKDNLIFYVDANHNPVPVAKMATYYYSRTPEIHVIDNVVYQLEPGQDPNSLYQSNEAKTEARQRAVASKPQQAAYKVITDFQAEDVEVFDSTIPDIEAELTNLKKDETEKHELLSTAIRNKEQVESLLSMAYAMKNTPRPTPKYNEVKPSLSPERQKFVDELDKQIKTQPAPALYDFIQEHAPKEDKFLLKAYMDKNFVNKMTSGSPLSPPEQASLLQYAKKISIQNDMIQTLTEHKEEKQWKAPSPLPKSPFDKK